MSWDQPRLTNLRKILAALYPREADQRRLVRDAELDEAAIAFDASAANSWSAILSYAKNRAGRVDALLAIAVDEHPENELLARAREDNPPRPLEADAELRWNGPKSSRALLEKLTGEASALVPVSYLSLGLVRARAVAKVALAHGSGSGFLVGENTLVTNHHVLRDPADAETATAIFDFQRTVEGLDEQQSSLRLRPDLFFATSADDDWTAVRVEGNPNERWGALELRPATVKPGERVNIIQHPGGSYKQMSFFANTVAFVGENRVQYLTDTLPGSSGSPVFDRAWNVVALHHSGGWLIEPGSQSDRTFYRNEGILVDAVIAGLAAARRS